MNGGDKILTTSMEKIQTMCIAENILPANILIKLKFTFRKRVNVDTRKIVIFKRIAIWPT